MGLLIGVLTLKTIPSGGLRADSSYYFCSGFVCELDIQEIYRIRKKSPGRGPAMAILGGTQQPKNIFFGGDQCPMAAVRHTQKRNTRRFKARAIQQTSRTGLLKYYVAVEI